MKHILLTLLGAAFITGSVTAQKKIKSEATTEAYVISKELTVKNDALHFFVIGDWGRNGEEHQRDVAIMMSQAATVIEPEFIISTGDNLYPNGVASTQDPLWMSSFENIYKEHNLHCTWNVVLGNHDYRGNIQAEIDYTKVSRRWNMPATYFAENKMLDDGTKISFTYIDSNPFEDDYYEEDIYKKGVSQQDTLLQKAWMERQFSQPATWKIAIGHHPMYTGGKRKDEVNTVRKHLEPLFTHHNVDAYFAGHEHDLQYLKPSGPTHHFVSGCGSEARPTGEIAPTKFSRSIQGFMIVSITKTEMLVQVVDYLGHLLYTANITK